MTASNVLNELSRANGCTQADRPFSYTEHDLQNHIMFHSIYLESSERTTIISSEQQRSLWTLEY